MLNLVCLFDLDAHTDAVDARLDQDTLALIARNSQRVQNELRRALGLNFRDVVSFRGLRREVGEGERSGKGGSDTLQIGSQ